MTVWYFCKGDIINLIANPLRILLNEVKGGGLIHKGKIHTVTA